jgi:ketosteroid isomerase-like protein
MNLPEAVVNLIDAQNRQDSVAYAESFSETAVVFDEGRIYTGRAEIKGWNEKSSQKYQTILKPISYQVNGINAVMKTEVSGTFDGSPLTLLFHFNIKSDYIHSLSITGLAN